MASLKTEIVAVPNIHAPDSPYRQTVETINRNSMKGLVTINKLAGQIFATDSAYESARDILGTSTADRARTLKAVTEHAFPAEKTLDPETYSRLLVATFQKEEISRQLILQHIESGANFGMKPHEIAVLKTSCELGRVYDELGMKWRAELKENPEAYSKAKDNDLTDRYTMIVGEPGNYKEVSWIEKFPEEIEEISKKWQELSGNLLKDSNNPDAVALGKYFSLYEKAFAAQIPDDRPYSKEVMDEMWNDVDRAWMGVTGLVQPIGTREYGYYDSSGIRAFPDFRLSFLVDEEGIKTNLQATKTAMQKHLGKRFENYEVYKNTVNALDSAVSYPIVDIVYTGSLDFQPAGQSLPNEEVVFKEFGTKSFINAEVARGRWVHSQQVFKRVFQDKNSEDLLKSVNVDNDGIAIALAGHELGEPLFQTEKAYKTLGDQSMTLLNEDLANLCISGIMRDRVAAGELNNNDLIKHAVYLLGTYVRMIDVGRESSTLQPYYIGNALQGLRRMVDSGFIYKDGDDWTINPEKTDELFKITESDLETIVKFSEEGNSEEAEKYIALAQETKDIKDIIEHIKPHTFYQ